VCRVPVHSSIWRLVPSANRLISTSCSSSRFPDTSSSILVHSAQFQKLWIISQMPACEALCLSLSVFIRFDTRVPSFRLYFLSRVHTVILHCMGSLYARPSAHCCCCCCCFCCQPRSAQRSLCVCSSSQGSGKCGSTTSQPNACSQAVGVPGVPSFKSSESQSSTPETRKVDNWMHSKALAVYHTPGVFGYV